MDTSMLQPVLRTCRQLRTIATSHPTLWRTFSADLSHELRAPLLREGCVIPLIGLISGRDRTGCAKDFNAVEVPRFHELHIARLGTSHQDDHQTAKLCQISRHFQASLPSL
ncbi:hypothetical protein BD309DRAFT_130815 [Dichomitus squalens]|nr:hypothetical protein BD309DRAFT_130815 [Dichomitus squalens]